MMTIQTVSQREDIVRIEDVQVIGKPLVRAKSADVDALESRLWLRLPAGYREYVTRLGEGVLGGDLVRIYPPWRIEKELAEWRRRINKYWFWDEGHDMLPKERALECVIIGDTVNGDEVVFHPRRVDHLFVLPRDSGSVYDAGSHLFTAIDWLCTSGELTEPFKERSFKPFDSRKEASQREAQSAVADPEGESLDEIVDIASRWAKRHSTRKQAMKDLRAQVPKGAESELLHEAIILEGQSATDIGYGIAWRVVEKDRGRELGVFGWNKSADSSGSAFEPTKRR